MKRLIKSEFFILSKSKIYKCLLIACCFPALDTGRQKSIGLAEATGYEWFCVIQLMGGRLLELVCIFAADYVVSGYLRGTFKMGICCGFTRKKILGAKIIAYITGVVPMFLIDTVVGTVSRTIKYGFGAKLNSETVGRMAEVYAYHILTSMLVFSMFYFFWAVVTKNRVITIIFGLVSLQFIGVMTARTGMITGKMEDSATKVISQYFLQFNPIYQADSLLDPQHFKHIPFSQFVISVVVCVLLITYISMHIFEKSDLR